MTILFEPDLSIGMTVLGKWHKTKYEVERLLGQGANGKVYLVRRGKQLFALKLGFDSLDLQSEVNALRALSKTANSGNRYLIDADDFFDGERNYPFYVMKYIDGLSIPRFLRQSGLDWFYLVGFNLLRRLADLHKQGWIFGDLKMDNILVSGYGEVELIDYGGVTPLGRSVKQFTEMYDRGYWDGGNRTADAAYDLFSFSVLCVQAIDPLKRIDTIDRILPQNRNVDHLLGFIETCPLQPGVASLLRKMIAGEVTSAAAACMEWRKHMLGNSLSRPRIQKTGSWLGGFFIASLLLFIAVFYYTFYW